MTKFLNLSLLMVGNLDLDPGGKSLKFRVWGMGEAREDVFSLPYNLSA